MNMTARKSTSSGARPHTDTASKVRLTELMARDRALTEEMIELENRSPQRLPPRRAGNRCPGSISDHR